jgi:L-lysine 2,3-aminomutase
MTNHSKGYYPKMTMNDVKEMMALQAEINEALRNAVIELGNQIHVLTKGVQDIHTTLEVLNVR